MKPETLHAEALTRMISEGVDPKEMLAYFTARGAEVNPDALIPNRNDGTRLVHLAAALGRDVHLSVLAARGADIKAVDDEGWTPLHWAASRGQYLTVANLSDKGVDLDAVDREGVSVVELAAKADIAEGRAARWPTARQLLLHGADPEALDAAGILHWKSNDEDLIELVRMGAGPNATTARGDSLLHWAVAAGHTKAIAFLIQEGADPEAVDKKGRTPLWYAARLGCAETVDALLKAGADPNFAERGDDVLSPLHCAALSDVIPAAFGSPATPDHMECARLLLQAGADPGALDAFGITALDRCPNKHRETFIKHIRDTGAALVGSLNSRQERASESHGARRSH